MRKTIRKMRKTIRKMIIREVPEFFFSNAGKMSNSQTI